MFRRGKAGIQEEEEEEEAALVIARERQTFS